MSLFYANNLCNLYVWTLCAHRADHSSFLFHWNLFKYIIVSRKQWNFSAYIVNRFVHRFVPLIFSKEYPHRNGGYFGGVLIRSLLVTIGYSAICTTIYVETEHVLRLRTHDVLVHWPLFNARRAFSHKLCRVDLDTIQFPRMPFFSSSYFWNILFCYLPCSLPNIGKCHLCRNWAHSIQCQGTYFHAL